MLPTSKSQANQRAGRAGREAAGKCYRLYQEIVFEGLEPSTAPEMDRVPLGQTMLQLLGLRIPNLDLWTFPFPSPPSPRALRQGLVLLVALGAVEVTSSTTVIISATCNSYECWIHSRLTSIPFKPHPNQTPQEKKQSPAVNLTPLGIRMASLPLDPQLALLLLKAEEYG